MSRSANDPGRPFRLRAGFVIAAMLLGAAGLLFEALRLQIFEREFLISEGDARLTRNVTTGADRGTITDRNASLLAISTPVVSVWAVPAKLGEHPDRWPDLARALGRNPGELAQRISSSQSSKHLWLARQLPRAQAEVVRRLQIPGVQFTPEQKRFYPAGEVAGHVVGFTSVDEVGQEGIELLFDSVLAGEPGLKRVYQDREGRRVADIENIRTARPGNEVALSIDMRLQSLANRVLKTAIDSNKAAGGAIVMIDVTTGEILVMAVQPAFNPNDRDQLKPSLYRNRAVTDYLEPGSSIKPFVIAAALESGRFTAASRIDVSAGYVMIGNHPVDDPKPLGVLTLAGVLAKSSNAAMAKISQQIEPQQIWTTLTQLGFGHVTAAGFSGESAGLLTSFRRWNPLSIASLSYGYGLGVTPLQLAQAYAAVGALGVVRPVSILRRDEPVAGSRAMSEQNARALIGMLESVVVAGGTGTNAAIPGYRVAGKTGTALKTNGSGSYYDDRYIAVFGGLAPASNPRLAAVVVIDDPAAGLYYAGDVCAPLFSTVVGGALRLMGVAPDRSATSSDPQTGVSTMVQR